jgi:hypothetical protein
MPSKNQKKAKKAAAAAAGGGAGSEGPSPSVPENFQKMISDMCADLSTTFPEYAASWSAWTAAALDALAPEEREQQVRRLFQHCTAVFPERFFDILYKNADIFAPGNTANTEFLPGVDFKTLFQCEGVSENTCNVMWNYLQLILFTIVGSVNDRSRFGDSKNLFEGIDESDLLEKLTETMKSMTDFFQGMAPEGPDTGDAADTEGKPSDREEIPIPPPPNFPKMPNLEELHNHLKGLFDGKIGAMAKELAEEISGDLSSILGEDAKDIRSTKDMLQKLMKNPAKISQLIQTIGEKLKKKMSSGEVSQEELMKEATDLLNRMKSMGGDMGAFKDMFKNMGMPMPKNARMDMNALNRMTQQQSMRERLKARMMQKKMAEAEAAMKAAATQGQTGGNGANPNLSLEELSRSLGLDLNETVGATAPKPSAGKKNKKR